MDFSRLKWVYPSFSFFFCKISKNIIILYHQIFIQIILNADIRNTRTQIRQEKLFRKKNIFGFRQNPIFPKNWFLAKKIVNNEYKYFFSSEMNCPYQNVYSYKILSNLDIRIAKKKKVVFWPYLIKSTTFDRSTTSHKSPPILKVNILSQSTWFQLSKSLFTF